VYKSIPWDIWAAAAIAGTIALAMMFEPGHALFIAGYLLCALTSSSKRLAALKTDLGRKQS
jgi:hypothetical protein